MKKPQRKKYQNLRKSIVLSYLKNIGRLYNEVAHLSE
nr:MAG TPA: hypothetical protein [Caudoviricetes sp.]